MDSPSDWVTWIAFGPAPVFYSPLDAQPDQSNRQPELNSMLPPTLPLTSYKHTEARKYTARDWDAQKAEITRLYEENTLERVMELMNEHHGLTATTKQYKDRIKKWNLNKNIQTDEMEAMIRKQRQRALIQKRSAFRLRDRQVNPEKIRRYINEHPKLDITLNGEEGAMALVATPAAISCYTPVDTGPLTPAVPPSSPTKALKIISGQPQAALEEAQNPTQPDLDERLTDIRRLSVDSLLMGPPGFSYLKNQTINQHGIETQFAPTHSFRYSDVYGDTTIYGIDHGFKDLDIGRNDDMNAISGSSSISTGQPKLVNEVRQFIDGHYYDRPVRVEIPRILEPLPSKLLENPMNLLYFHHYLNHTADFLIPHSCPSNPFKTVLPQIAICDDDLLNILLACSASHRARLLCQPEPATRIALWVQDVFRNLRHALALDGLSKMLVSSKLATVILLASLEIISPNAFGVPIPWQRHLDLARKIIKARDGIQTMQSLQGDKVSRFLLTWFAYLDVLGSLSGGELIGDSSTSEWDLDHEIAEEDEYQVGCLLGFTTRCLHILSNIAVLARKCYKERMRLPVPSEWRPSNEIWDRAEKLEAHLSESRYRVAHFCIHRRFPGEVSYQWDQLEMAATNEAFHWAGLVHLHRRVLGKSSTHVDVHQAVQEILGSLYKIRRGSAAEACLLFPIFTAGCESQDTRVRADLLERMKSLECSGTTQTHKARALMERVWETGKPWETLVAGEFLA